MIKLGTIKIVRISNMQGSQIEPAGWRGAKVETTVIRLPISRSIRAKVIELHEYAHMGQIASGEMTDYTYPRQRVTYEAEASALALQWVRPELFAAAVCARITALQSHIDGPDGPKQDASTLIQQAMRRVAGRWRAYRLSL